MHKKKTKLTKLTKLTIPVPYLNFSFYKEAHRTVDNQPITASLVKGACRTRLSTSQVHWSLPSEKDYKVIRPLLNCSRYCLTAMCEQLNVPVYPDKSNHTVQYSRNRIRKQIIPSLKIFFNPQVEDAIFRFAEHMIKIRWLAFANQLSWLYKQKF